MCLSSEALPVWCSLHFTKLVTEKQMPSIFCTLCSKPGSHSNFFPPFFSGEEKSDDFSGKRDMAPLPLKMTHPKATRAPVFHAKGLSQAYLRDTVGSVPDYGLQSFSPQICENRMSIKCNKGKHSKTGYACIGYLILKFGPRVGRFHPQIPRALGIGGVPL